MAPCMIFDGDQRMPGKFYYFIFGKEGNGEWGMGNGELREFGIAVIFGE